ncbi:MAG: YbjN domain-containing protein [Cyanobacteria bacterium P01_F01_bin.3]
MTDIAVTEAVESLGDKTGDSLTKEPFLTLFNTPHQPLSVPLSQIVVAADTAPSPYKTAFVLSLSYVQYSQVVEQAWFNLTANLSKPASDFSPEDSIQITVILNSNLEHKDMPVGDLEAHCLENRSLKIDITTLANAPYSSPLLQSNSWFCTALSGVQPNSQAINYYTLWHYLLPALSTPNSDTLAHSINQYIQSETAESLAHITQTTAPLFQDLAQTFQSLFTEVLTDVTEEFTAEAEKSEHSLLRTLTDFLDSEEWPYTLASESIETTLFLRLAFKGENGQWSCYATVNESTHICCFYSMSPIHADVNQETSDANSLHLQKLAEFITRANSGMIIGNFELDYADGTLRYKTSLDVQDTQLSEALLRNLVYTNVLTMDQYLPGIQSVLQTHTSPAAAIAAIESSSTNA